MILRNSACLRRIAWLSIPRCPFSVPFFVAFGTSLHARLSSISRRRFSYIVMLCWEWLWRTRLQPLHLLANGCTDTGALIRPRTWSLWNLTSTRPRPFRPHNFKPVPKLQVGTVPYVCLLPEQLLIFRVGRKGADKGLGLSSIGFQFGIAHHSWNRLKFWKVSIKAFWIRWQQQSIWRSSVDLCLDHCGFCSVSGGWRATVRRWAGEAEAFCKISQEIIAMKSLAWSSQCWVRSRLEGVRLSSTSRRTISARFRSTSLGWWSALFPPLERIFSYGSTWSPRVGHRWNSSRSSQWYFLHVLGGTENSALNQVTHTYSSNAHTYIIYHTSMTWFVHSQGEKVQGVAGNPNWGHTKTYNFSKSFGLLVYSAIQCVQLLPPESWDSWEVVSESKLFEIDKDSQKLRWGLLRVWSWCCLQWCESINCKFIEAWSTTGWPMRVKGRNGHRHQSQP